jgi:hypothetical protein
MGNSESNPPERPALDLIVRAAERAHDDEKEFGAKANDAATKAAEEAIRAAILINGGSSVAMLAFIGSVASKDWLSPVQLAALTKPLLFFGFGVAAAVIGSAMAYFTNLMIAGSSIRRRREYQQPFLRITPSSRRHWIWGEVFRWLGIVAVTGSIVLFIAGLFQASSAFNSLATHTSPIAFVG